MSSKNLKIAIAAEITPAKTFIPIIHKLKDLEINNNLNWNKVSFVGLYHGEGAKDLLNDVCDELYSIGEGRRGTKKNSNFKLFYLILKDIFKAINAMAGKNIDILLTCGNAGDVRKSIIAAKILKIPIIHIEQDIYNPIEVIGLANIITVPSASYIGFMEDTYGLDNIFNIGGYPMVKFVEDSINNIKPVNSSKDYVLLVLGGDIKVENLEELIFKMENLRYDVLIAPYRFDKSLVEGLVSSDNIYVLDNYVNLFEYIPNSKVLIYAAGMGMTVEVGVFGCSALKLEGFHKVHGSVDLARKLNIPIVKISDINDSLIKEDIFINNGEFLNSSSVSIDNFINLLTTFDFSSKSNGFSSIKSIWNQRKKFR